MIEATDDTDVIFSPCAACVYKSRRGPTCAAFPDGIPDEILEGRNSHTAPYPGDKGLLFTPAVGTGDVRLSASGMSVREIQLTRMGWAEALAAASEWNRDWLKIRWRWSETDLKAEHDRVVGLMEKARGADKSLHFGRLPKLKRLNKWPPDPTWLSDLTEG
jgi:hypothetical protein